MSVTVRVPPVFRPLTSGQSTVSVEGATVSQVLASLESAYPGFSSKLLSDDGSLVRYVNLFVDDDDVRFMEGLDTVVPDGVTVSIMQAVAGGA
ncbi:MAG: MoaD/ThiS family protein [Acidimicrobiales bacterium]